MTGLVGAGLAGAALTGAGGAGAGGAGGGAGAGAGLTRALPGHERAVEVAGAVILVAVAARGLLGLRRSAGPSAQVATASSPLRVTARFVALTVINPLTAVYFVALAAGAGDSV